MNLTNSCSITYMKENIGNSFHVQQFLPSKFAEKGVYLGLI